MHVSYCNNPISFLQIEFVIRYDYVIYQLFRVIAVKLYSYLLFFLYY